MRRERLPASDETKHKESDLLSQYFEKLQKREPVSLRCQDVLSDLQRNLVILPLSFYFCCLSHIS